MSEDYYVMADGRRYGPYGRTTAEQVVKRMRQNDKSAYLVHQSSSYTYQKQKSYRQGDERR